MSVQKVERTDPSAFCPPAAQSNALRSQPSRKASAGTAVRSTSAALVGLLLAGCVSTPKIVENPPPAPREFRGVWVATVNNIDWPSATGLSADQQRAEAIAQLDKARALNLNAIILQVRPAADALYPSALEPWTEYLTGKQGGDPGYDPLMFWVEEAHRRGLQLHAWFNPYRARHNLAKSDFVPTHMAKTHPASVKIYGDYWWMDPGDTFASQRTVEVVADVVKRYDVDGAHIDDYFYPYPIPDPRAPKPKPGDPAAVIDFPDQPSWDLYRKDGGKLSREDWRRRNVDDLVERLYHAVHTVKPNVMFGVSPFGLGRPDRRPDGIKGFSQYDKLYADVELWLERGWLDYLAPQLYWRLEQKEQAFEVLLDYWTKQNVQHRHVWPGLFTSAINETPKSWAPGDILKQIEVMRTHPPAGGHIQYSMIALMQDRQGVTTKLQAGPYAGAALTPVTPWLETAAPPAPTLKKPRDGGVKIVPAKLEAKKPVRQTANYAIWRRYGTEWRFAVQPVGEAVVAVNGADAVVVSAVDRLGNESARVALTLERKKK